MHANMLALLLPFLLILSPHSLAQDTLPHHWSSQSDRPADEAYREAVHHLSSISPVSNVRPSRQPIRIGRYLKDTARSFFLGGPPSDGALSFTSHDRLASANNLLHHAAQQNHPDAIYMLANMNFFGNYSSTRNLTQAFRRYQQLAELTGNSSAQHMIGFFYSTGVGGVVEEDQARALLYYKFAAAQGNERAQMALAYRYHYGIGTPKDCHTAVEYWQSVAQKAIQYVRTGPPGNHIMMRLGYRISDDHGGIYGEGASVSSAGINAKHGPANSDAHASHGDVLEWLDLISRKGDIKATFSLGKMHFEGARDMKPDYLLAKRYFLEVARQYWTKSGKVRNDVSAVTESLAGRAAGFLGWMSMRGEGTEQNFSIAKKWFKRGVALGNSQSQYSLGLLYLDGLSVPKDVKRAAELFTAAADQDNPAAQVSIARLYLDSGDVQTALKYLDLAVRKGHIEALYYLAETEKAGIGQEPSCELASHHFKLVVERAEPLVASFAEANKAYEAGDIDLALLDYMLAAEQGFEVAQTNVAFLLDKSHRRQKLLRFPILKQAIPVLTPRISLPLPSSLALLYWTRSARQSNIDAMVKMGDYYLAGVGVDPSADKAAACYQAAAETMQSAQALWNLGWMYENGLGGHEQDFHLAKRFYDQALEINNEAYLPVTLALFKLRLRSRWNSWTRGSAKSIQEEPRTRRRPISLRNWISEFLAAEAEHAAQRAERDEDLPPGGDWRGDSLADLTDEELWDELVDGLLESVVILGLAAALIVLVIYRRQRAERRAIEEQRARLAGTIPGQVVPEPAEGQQADDGNEGGRNDDQNPDRGLFPAQGDAGFIDWAVGGVGH